jgi:translation initiation factor IF-3
VKEVQLSPGIDPHDFGVKLNHAIDFLCEDMKVKVTLRFRGREMAHKEFGFQQVNHFVKDLAPWGTPDFEPKLIGKGINVMISPLPRSKRAKHPKETDGGDAPQVPAQNNGKNRPAAATPPGVAAPAKPAPPAAGFANNPFTQLEDKVSS